MLQVNCQPSQCGQNNSSCGRNSGNKLCMTTDFFRFPGYDVGFLSNFMRFTEQFLTKSNCQQVPDDSSIRFSVALMSRLSLRNVINSSGEHRCICQHDQIPFQILAASVYNFSIGEGDLQVCAIVVPLVLGHIDKRSRVDSKPLTASSGDSKLGAPNL